MLEALRLLTAGLFALALATAAGLGATWWTVANGLPAVGLRIGPWKAEPDAGTLNADPYEIAATARSGEAPLAYGDGLAFTAETDDDGRPLDSSCAYELSGELPAARLWTVSPFMPDGRRFSADARDLQISSASLVRIVGEPIRIAFSRAAQPGAWVPIEGEGRFVLRLTLYETTIGTPLELQSPSRLLSIRRGACG